MRTPSSVVACSDSRSGAGSPHRLSAHPKNQALSATVRASAPVVSNVLLSLLYIVPVAGSALALVSIFNERRTQPRWLRTLHQSLQDRLEAIGNRLNNKQAGGAS